MKRRGELPTAPGEECRRPGLRRPASRTDGFSSAPPSVQSGCIGLAWAHRGVRLAYVTLMFSSMSVSCLNCMCGVCHSAPSVSRLRAYLARAPRPPAAVFRTLLRTTSARRPGVEVGIEMDQSASRADHCWRAPIGCSRGGLVRWARALTGVDGVGENRNGACAGGGAWRGCPKWAIRAAPYTSTLTVLPPLPHDGRQVKPEDADCHAVAAAGGDGADPAQPARHGCLAVGVVAPGDDRAVAPQRQAVVERRRRWRSPRSARPARLSGRSRS